MNNNATRVPGRGATPVSAFTLIELLVVISIIGILAALIIPLSGVATSKMRISRVRAELNQYITAIENYKAEVGFYPPDNGDLKKVTTDLAAYKTNAAFNPLFYELSGCVYTNGQFRSVAEGDSISPATYQKYFNREGVQNSSRNKHDIEYKGLSLRIAQYAEYEDASKGGDVELLNVPVPGPFEFKGDKNKKINPWFYDSSTTNRHNRAGFDLWAEIIIGRKNETMIIGNWKN